MQYLWKAVWKYVMPFATCNFWLYALRRSEIQTKVYGAKYFLKDILLRKMKYYPL